MRLKDFKGMICGPFREEQTIWQTQSFSGTSLCHVELLSTMEVLNKKKGVD